MSEEPEFSDDPSPSSAPRGGAPPGPDKSEPETGEQASPPDPSDAFGRDPFSDADDSPFSGGDPMDGPSRQDQARMAWDMTRMWVKEHQTAAMLGAFAAGVFVGAYVRD